MTEMELPVSPGKIALAVVGLVVLVVIVFAVGGSFYTVPANSEAVVLRFGRYHATTGPGLHGKLPFGVDRALVVPVRRNETMEFGFTTLSAGRVSKYRVTNENRKEKAMLTGDLNIALVEWAVQYLIKEEKEKGIKAYLFNLAQVEDTIRDVSESVMRELVGDRSVDEVITVGREALAAEARGTTQRILDEYDCGIKIVALTLKDATPPDDVKQAFEAVNSAQQKKDELINKALKRRNELIPAARGEKAQKIKEAEGYKEEKVRSARGRAEALLAQYREYKIRPRETRLRLFMETMEEVYKRAGRKIIVDPDVKGVLPLLDLGGGTIGGAQ